MRQFAIWQWQLSPYQRPTNTTPACDPLDEVSNDLWLSIKSDDIQAYLACISNEKGFKPGTVIRHLSALKGLVDKMAELGLYDETENSRIQNRIKSPKGNGQHFSKIHPEDQNTILEAAASLPGLRGTRDYLMVRLLLETGVRRYELLQLRVRNILVIADQPTIYIEFAKNDQTRNIPIEADTYGMIREWLLASGQGDDDNNPIFCPLRERHKGEGDYIALNKNKPMTAQVLNNIMNNLISLANLDPDAEKITPHRFRVSMVTDTIEGGATMRQVQKSTGHASTAMIERIYDQNKYMEPVSKFRKHKLFKPGQKGDK